jgi:hypothetical protein
MDHLVGDVAIRRISESVLLQIDFLDLSCGPSIWTNSTIFDDEALKILTM